MMTFDERLTPLETSSQALPGISADGHFAVPMCSASVGIQITGTIYMTPRSSHGSETRQRNHTVGVRLSPDEKDTITTKADRHKVSVSAFMREAALHNDEDHAISPLSEGQQIALVLACLGRMADLVTDFENDAYGTASDRYLLLTALRREIIAVRDQCFASLRRRP